MCELAKGFVSLRGERSRHFGPEGKADRSLSDAGDNLSSDLFFRGINDARTVEKLLDQPAPVGPSHQAKELMHGWAAGYNAWLRQNRVTDPACKGADWIRPVTALDVARRGYAITVLGGQGAVADSITGARPPSGPAASKPDASRPKSAPAPADPAQAARALFSRRDAAMGSNAVAFSGSTTAGGHGLLLGNPHYPWEGGRRFWQSQLTIPGELDVAGGSLLGLPMISIGHNAHTAWSHTVSTGVPINVYELKTAPSDPYAYLVDGKPDRSIVVARRPPPPGPPSGDGRLPAGRVSSSRVTLPLAQARCGRTWTGGRNPFGSRLPRSRALA